MTPNGVLVVGNNEGGTYFALRDDGANATLPDTLTVAANGTARSTATLSSDGLLHLPARLVWSRSKQRRWPDALAAGGESLQCF